MKSQTVELICVAMVKPKALVCVVQYPALATVWLPGTPVFYIAAGVAVVKVYLSNLVSQEIVGVHHALNCSKSSCILQGMGLYKL